MRSERKQVSRKFVVRGSWFVVRGSRTTERYEALRDGRDGVRSREFAAEHAAQHKLQHNTTQLNSSGPVRLEWVQVPTPPNLIQANSPNHHSS